MVSGNMLYDHQNANRVASDPVQKIYIGSATELKTCVAVQLTGVVDD